jgi:DNA polymerase-3 subunit epsilon
MNKDTVEAAIWAKELIKRKDWVILDTETTGLHATAQICQIGICNHRGETIMDELVKPGSPMTFGAYQVHGIHEDILKDAPPFPDIYHELCSAVNGKLVIIYNAKFDRRIIRHCCQFYNLPVLRCKEIQCLMQEYSRWFGNPRKNGGYKYKKLPGGDHSAIGDCLAALKVIREMAATEIAASSC